MKHPKIEPVKAQPNFISTTWYLLPIKLRIWIIWEIYKARLIRTPRPIKFSVTTAIATFICLSFLPTHPISMPTAMGLGLIAALLIIWST